MSTEVAIPEPTTEKAVAVQADIDPASFIEFAAKQATALAAVIDKQKLFTIIQGRKHVNVEGWQTLGALNRLQAFTELVEVERFMKPNDSQTRQIPGIRVRAVVSARRTTDGVAVAQAEGFCSSEERTWSQRDEYAIRSMAQTRATSKVFRQALAWVMTLAGYDTTPAEEMPRNVEREGEPLTDEQVAQFSAAIDASPNKPAAKKAVSDVLADLGYRGWKEFADHGREDFAPVLAEAESFHTL